MQIGRVSEQIDVRGYHNNKVKPCVLPDVDPRAFVKQRVAKKELQNVCVIQTSPKHHIHLL